MTNRVNNTFYSILIGLIILSILTNSKEGSLGHLPTIMVTFLQAAFVLLTFGHIRNISAVTDPILCKLFGPYFLGALIFVDQSHFKT